MPNRSALTQHEIVTDLHPLHRTLVSEGTDDALARIGEYLGSGIEYEIERYKALDPAWTWRVPERWEVREAYLETEEGERFADWADSPLHVISYSLAVDQTLSFDELLPHLRWNEKLPATVPWEFAYYQRTWGFCISKDTLDRMPRDAKYRAVIKSEFLTGTDDGLAVGVAKLPTPGARDDGEFLLCAHICHPMQANDDAAGVATAIEVMRRLKANPLPEGALNVRLLICPEQIGSVCYLSHNEDLIPKLRAGIFCEMTGNDNTLALQRSRQDCHDVDRIARSVLDEYEGSRHGAFREVVGNDEIVINGPGVDCPCIAVTRWPYPEYHTSDDSPDILTEERMSEAADAIEEIVRRAAVNYIPKRTFRGPVMLSAFGLWVDWRENWDLNHALEKIMLSFEGDRSVSDIALQLGLPFWDAFNHIERFRDKGLIEALPIPTAVNRLNVATP